MGHVIAVDDPDAEPAVLTETTVDGLFGGALLAEDPLAAHLDESEQPRYVLRNKKRGLTVERDNRREHVEPASDYQALAVVTDVRVVVAVGQSRGDVVTEIPLVDVIDASASDGFVAGTLRISTADGDDYEFPCRGDLGPVGGYVDRTAQAWVRAYRLLDDAGDHLDAAADRLSADEFSAALDAVGDATDAIETARDRLAAVGDGAVARFAADSEAVRSRARAMPRTIHAERGRTVHEDARALWRDGEYEQAYDRLETAIDAYRDATDSPGEDPPDDAVEEWRSTAEAERAELARAPLARAQQVAQGAVSIDGPATAAARWETAIRRYQEALWLDWGRDERRFDGDPEALRESIVDAVDNLVTERRAAARACREAARDHRMAGSTDAARAAYRTALDHVERAQSVVAEVAPNRETGLDDTVAAIEDELAAVDEGPDARRSATSATGESSADGSGTDLVERVADYWETHGWSVERRDGDLVATCTEPVAVSAAVRVLGSEANDSTAADALSAAVEEALDLAGAVDARLAVVATDENPTAEVRDRAEAADVLVQDVREFADDAARSSPDVGPV